MMIRSRASRLRSMCALVVTLLAIASPASPGAACAPSSHPGGEWRSLNHDVHNTRHQEAEAVIDPASVANLELAWSLDTGAVVGEAGSLQSTPAIADGCVYVASGTSGWVFSINADSGTPVWSEKLPGGVLGLSAQDGRVYAGSFRIGNLRAQALDQGTGSILWQTPPLTDPDRPQDGEVIHASPVVFDGMYFVAVSRGVGPDSRPPLYFLDASTGAVLKKIVAVSEEDHARGYAGAGAWSTAAVDTVNKVLYVATADSEAFKTDHKYNNAFLKIDANRTSPTFGTILASYKGDGEHYIDGLNLYDQPACQALGDEATGTSPSSSLTCLELDLDFGASVNLFTGSDGRVVVGAMQKSGAYHAAYGDSMERAWRLPLSPPMALGNSSTSAVGSDRIYATANPSTIASLDAQDGAPQWVSSALLDAVRYQPMTLANGVVYTVTTTGLLLAFDAATGAPLLQRPMALDIEGGVCSTLGGGVAVARNTIYAQCDEPGILLAYRLPEPA